MHQFLSVSQELKSLIKEWENTFSSLPEDVISQRRNKQNRTVRQIIGHMVDSASNNTHRVVHLQYQKSPFDFPNYATLGNNDRWIAIQNYQEEDWNDLIQLWKYSNLHFTHVIGHIDPKKMANEWIASADKNLSLRDMVLDFPRHFKLHLEEIRDLIT
ncbi:MAG: DinB family protein [Bacteroidales bacterium]|jgi:hypothetical protein